MKASSIRVAAFVPRPATVLPLSCTGALLNPLQFQTGTGPSQAPIRKPSAHCFLIFLVLFLFSTTCLASSSFPAQVLSAHTRHGLLHRDLLFADLDGDGQPD